MPRKQFPRLHLSISNPPNSRDIYFAVTRFLNAVRELLKDDLVPSYCSGELTLFFNKGNAGFNAGEIARADRMESIKNRRDAVIAKDEEEYFKSLRPTQEELAELEQYEEEQQLKDKKVN